MATLSRGYFSGIPEFVSVHEMGEEILTGLWASEKPGATTRRVSPPKHHNTTYYAGISPQLKWKS